MVEIRQSQATIENALKRLTRDREAYEKEQAILEKKLACTEQPKDKYEINLITEQINETRKALEMVRKSIEEYSCSLGEK